MADKQNSSHKTLDHIMDKFLARMQSRRNERNDSRHPSPERRRSGWIRRVRSTVCIPSPSSTLLDGPTRPAAAPTAQPLRSNIPPSMTSSNLRPDQFRRPIPPRRPAQLRRPVQLRPLPSTRPLATSTRPLPPWARPLLPCPPKHKTTLLRLLTNPPPPTVLPPPNPIFIDPRVACIPPRTPYDLLLAHLLGRTPDPRPEIPRSPSIHYLSPRSTVYFTRYLAPYLSLPPDLPAPVIVYCLLTRWTAVRRHLAAVCPWMAAYELGVDWTGVERDPWTEVVSGASGMGKALGAWVARREVLFPGPDPAVRKRSVPVWTMKRARVVRDWERRRRGPGWTVRVWGRSKLAGEVWVTED